MKITKFSKSVIEKLNSSKINYEEIMKIEKNCDVWNLNFQNAAFKRRRTE